MTCGITSYKLQMGMGIQYRSPLHVVILQGG